MKKLLPLLLLATFIVTVPVFQSDHLQKKPSVLAVFTQDPPVPVFKGSSKTIDLTATSVFVMDLDSGVVLYDKNPHQRLAPASLTKIMTALVAMDYYREDSILKVVNGQKSLGNTMDLVKGDQLLANDLLYGLLVPSGNDAAVTLAENYEGGYKAFVEKMNLKVTELGLTNTHFVNVSGVESPNHYTTAYDITQIARSGLERQLFSDIIATKSKSLKSLKGHIYPLVSTNILLNKPGFYGIKTGWTPTAGECLVILVENESHRVIISILKSKDRFGEGQKIADWVFKNYTWE